MTDPRPPGSRQLACAHCGAMLTCRPDGGCWCANEPFRLKVPAPGTTDCLCPDCLRAEARRQLAAPTTTCVGGSVPDQTGASSGGPDGGGS